MTRSKSRLSLLVRDHSPHGSVTDLARHVGDPGIVARVRYARANNQLPDGPTMRAIAEELDPIGVSLLVDSLAWDGRLPGYDGDPGISLRLSQAIRGMGMRERRIFLELLGLHDIDPTDW